MPMKETGMNAAKRIKKMLDENGQCKQLAVLKELALALELKLPFDLTVLAQLDGAHFQLAQHLLADWHGEQHIDARGRLIERLLAENPALMRPPAARRAVRGAAVKASQSVV
jgi:hypothetical protein